MCAIKSLLESTQQIVEAREILLLETYECKIKTHICAGFLLFGEIKIYDVSNRAFCCFSNSFKI